MKTKHHKNGCPWASGDLQSADTEQVTDWKKVTCKHCLRKNPEYLLRMLDKKHLTITIKAVVK